MKKGCKIIALFLMLLFAWIIPKDNIYAKTTVSLKVKPIVEDKVWNTSIPKNQNPNQQSGTYYYPWEGDDSAKVIGLEIVGLDEEKNKKKKELVEKYGATLSCDFENDVASCRVTNMYYLGEAPVEITWNKEPTFKVEKAEEAEKDNVSFVVVLEDATCNVIDNGADKIDESQWNAYYEKVKETINLILTYVEKTDGFESQENPCYTDRNVWAVFTAARCGYVPYGDPTWFDRWFKNTKEYLIKNKDRYNGDDLKSTDVAKLLLAIEAIGYDPRDIDGVDLLETEGRRNGGNTYTDAYAIHSIKAGGYSTKSFPDEEMEKWVHTKANALIKYSPTSTTFNNADNSMGYQPMIYWYGKEGFEDVGASAAYGNERFAAIAQRANGAICTNSYECGCPMYGNNAWNDAQALFMASEFDVNVLRPESGYTKNGNNILDAMFALINYEEGTVPGFYNYDVPQIARGLESFVRCYERDVLKKDSAPFWIFTDVEVPTKAVNDAILSLNGSSTDEDIANARAAYEALDETHKEIFNQEHLERLAYFENGGRDIEAAKELIDQIPAYDELKAEDKELVVSARAAYEKLSTDDRTSITAEQLDKLAKAEIKIPALEAEVAILDIANDFTAENIEKARQAYDTLTKEQQDIITTAYDKLTFYEEAIKVVEPVIGKINALNPSTLKLTDKSKVTAARKAYETLKSEYKELVAQKYLLKLSQAEKKIANLEKEKKNQLKKGQSFTLGKGKYKITKVSGKSGTVTMTGITTKNLTKYTIPATITYKKYTFKVTALGDKVFSSCKKLTTLTVGKNVTSIGKMAFYNCSKLKKITINATNLKKVGAKALKGIYKKAVIKVPKKKVRAYKKLLKGKGQGKNVTVK
ncbi:Leucine rich repeat-containing protein [Acetitomaculum ruminis DSM 5522]|uniref:Leucine rich repeat-containing protein n=1 Tax=Acetitomaculum ruminis DSM 5522 TaxID=1120918 RepID=A0A1I0W7V1_9FIRM|nr:leucine-rich repeat domain-containing protein [Acetitomaculum ruminis]SFA84782.1 Leucine rich repeat-containing protein [Acetitomaculum ruminis DSM 5522]